MSNMILDEIFENDGQFSAEKKVSQRQTVSFSFVHGSIAKARVCLKWIEG